MSAVYKEQIPGIIIGYVYYWRMDETIIFYPFFYAQHFALFPIYSAYPRIAKYI